MTTALAPADAGDMLADLCRGAERDRWRQIEIIRDTLAALAAGEAVPDKKRFGEATRALGMSEEILQSYLATIKSGVGQADFHSKYDESMAEIENQEQKARADCEDLTYRLVEAKRIRDRVVPQARERLWNERQQWTYFEQANEFFFSADLEAVEAAAKLPGLLVSETAAIQGERLRDWYAQEKRKQKLHAIEEAAK
jgi:hypothetical protein